MASHYDGAHCGLGDWYPEIERGIVDALEKPDEWTTGWYSSKKEIASACITWTDDGIRVEVSVSDDFDTPGSGEKTIAHTSDLERIRKAIYGAWDAAEEDQKANRPYVGYSVFTEVESYGRYSGGKGQGAPVKRQGWVETYIRPRVDAVDYGYYGCPPGDHYHQWGFQDEYVIPDDVKEQLEDWADTNDSGSHTVGEFTIKAWT